jgi:hypothetical protein
MGQAEQDFNSRRKENIERWNSKAKEYNYICILCGEFIKYDERTVYFETERCSLHQNED